MLDIVKVLHFCDFDFDFFSGFTLELRDFELGAHGL
jgi:ribonuclease D